VRIVGIDPGLAACGYGVVQTSGTGVRVVDYGCWYTRSGRPLALRLHELFEKLLDLLARSHAESVALVEESFVGREARGVLARGHVRGALLVACAQADVELVEVGPARVKQIVCGYGLSEKAQVQRMAKVLLGLDAILMPTPTADALATALCQALESPLLLQQTRSSQPAA
jgi:crossover junction endodeoxyribonuclease RuvC